MSEERKLNKWDRRRANKRINRFFKDKKHAEAIINADEVHVELPELTKLQKKRLEDAIRAKKKVKVRFES